MKRTFLSNEEIIDQWDAAKNKNVALDRLAIACRTDRAGMKTKLLALGVTADELEAVPAVRLKKTAVVHEDKNAYKRIDTVRARELYDAGKNDAEIAAELGTKHGTIYAWRKRNGLKANATSAFQQKKKEDKNVKYEECETENAVIEAEAEKALAGFEPVTPKKQGGFKLEPKAETEKKTDAWDGYTVPAPVRAAARETMTVGRFVEALGKYLTEAVADAELRINGSPVSGDLSFSIAVRNDQTYVDLGTREAG